MDKPVTHLLTKLGWGRWGRGNGPIRQLISNIRARRASPAPVYRPAPQVVAQRAAAPVAAAPKATPKPAAPKAAPAPTPKAEAKAAPKAETPKNPNYNPHDNSFTRMAGGRAKPQPQPAEPRANSQPNPQPTEPQAAKPAGSFLRSLAQGAGGAASGLLAGAQQALPNPGGHSLQGMPIPRDFNFGGGESNRQQNPTSEWTARDIVRANEADRVATAQAKYRVGNTGPTAASGFAALTPVYPSRTKKQPDLTPAEMAGAKPREGFERFVSDPRAPVPAGSPNSGETRVPRSVHIQSGPFRGRDPVAEQQAGGGVNAGPRIAGGFSPAMEERRQERLKPAPGVEDYLAMAEPKAPAPQAPQPQPAPEPEEQDTLEWLNSLNPLSAYLQQ